MKDLKTRRDYDFEDEGEGDRASVVEHSCDNTELCVHLPSQTPSQSACDKWLLLRMGQVHGKVVYVCPIQVFKSVR